MNRSKITLTLSVLSFLGMGCVARAAPQDSRGPGGPPGGRGPHEPPPEAFDACKSSKQGDACTVDFHGSGHTMTGTCEAPPEGEGLACRPSGPPPPPPED
jgi:hypothetical protein